MWNNLLYLWVWFGFKPTRFHTIEIVMKYDIKSGYIKSDGTPLKCPKCGIKMEYSFYKDKTISHSDYGVEEFERVCRCGHIVGYWSYGHWMN